MIKKSEPKCKYIKINKLVNLPSCLNPGEEFELTVTFEVLKNQKKAKVQELHLIFQDKDSRLVFGDEITLKFHITEDENQHISIEKD